MLFALEEKKFMDKKSNSRQFFKQHVEKQKIINSFLQLVGSRVLLLVHTLYTVWSSACASLYVTCAHLFPVLYVLVFAVCKAVGSIWYTFVIAND